MRYLSYLLLLSVLSGCENAHSSGATPSPSGENAEQIQAEASPIAFQSDPEAVKRLKAHVKMLAETIGPRNVSHPEAYKKATDYLASQLQAMGYKVGRQTFEVDGVECVNLWADLKAGEDILVVSAHYDSCDITPGADDNASGCAATLELVRQLKDNKEGPSVRFVLFANEEPPYFQTEQMGSLVYALACQKKGEKFMGMLSLESIGFYSDSKGSQEFPVGLTGYPDTGNFLGFVSDISSKPFMERCLDGFKEAKTMPAEGIAAPGIVTGITWSDHWSFSKCGYPAVMVTDTAPFRNPNYHAESDTSDTLDYQRLAAATEGLRRMILALGKQRSKGG